MEVTIRQNVTRRRKAGSSVSWTADQAEVRGIGAVGGGRPRGRREVAVVGGERLQRHDVLDLDRRRRVSGSRLGELCA